jgi:hypothetical protein
MIFKNSSKKDFSTASKTELSAIISAAGMATACIDDGYTPKKNK